MNSKCSRNAFTLAEMAVVLMVASFLLLLTPSARIPDTTELSFRLFVSDFLSQLENAQNYAVITGQAVRLELVKPIGTQSSARFAIQDTQNPFINRKMLFPAETTVRKADTFYIKGETGYIQPDTIVFQSPAQTVSIKIQMGNGRYHVEYAPR